MFRSTTLLALMVMLLASPLPAAENPYLEPIRPGIPGERPFWNNFSSRFIYPPAFEMPKVDGATQYQFTLQCADGKDRTFKADTPNAALTPVWADVPEGYVKATIDGIDASGKVMGRSGVREFYRSPGFDKPMKLSADQYLQSARTGLKAIVEADHVKHWLTDGKPDPTYRLYCYPSKVFGGLMRGTVAYSKIAEKPEDRERAIEIARKVADHLISISVPDDAAFPGFPPTYALNVDKPYKQAEEGVANHKLMIPSAADTALGHLDLYDATHDDRYLSAARKIVATYAKTQESDGTWPLLADYQTGKVLADQRTVPTWIIWLIDRMGRDYGVKDYESVRDRAWDWIERNPRKTYQWDGQFEDVKAHAPYSNLAREQACDVAVMLMNNADGHPERIAEAEELLRFAEDQFVIWEQVKRPDDWKKATKRGNPVKWMPPCVLEQYAVYSPVARSSAIVINTYLTAYRVTGKKTYLDRARSLASGLVHAQEWSTENLHTNGEIPTWIMVMQTPVNWLNNSFYAADAVLAVAETLAPATAPATK